MASLLKAIAKSMVREDYWSFLRWQKNQFGLMYMIRGLAFLLSNQGVGRAPNPLTGGHVSLRAGTADQDVYEEIFNSKEYDLDFDSPAFIVDAGAHIGLASIYFSDRYPAATIIAIEPEASNFAMLLRNTAGYTNIKPVNAGLWSKKGQLRIQDPGAANWNFRVSETSAKEGIPAIGIADVLAKFGVHRIDVLKIDIEGAELEVLNDHESWMDAVGILVIELHDRFRPGCSEALDQALRGYRYEQSWSGESIVITGIRRPQSQGQRI